MSNWMPDDWGYPNPLDPQYIGGLGSQGGGATGVMPTAGAPASAWGWTPGSAPGGMWGGAGGGMIPPDQFDLQLKDLDDQIEAMRRAYQSTPGLMSGRGQLLQNLYGLQQQRAALLSQQGAAAAMQQQGQGWGLQGFQPQFYGFDAQDVGQFEATERDRLMGDVASAMAARGMTFSSLHGELGVAAAAQARQYALPYMERQFARKTDWELAQWEMGERQYEFQQQMQLERQRMQLQRQMFYAEQQRMWETFTGGLRQQDWWSLIGQMMENWPGPAAPQQDWQQAGYEQKPDWWDAWAEAY